MNRTIEQEPTLAAGSAVDDAPHVSPADIADGICVHQLGGGLGNQLFEYAAGLAQARRLRCPLYVDVSAFRTYAARPFELGALGLPGRLVDVDFPRARADGTVGLRHRAAAALPPLSRVRLARRPVFRPATADFDRRIDDVAIGTTLSGYFQSPLYFAGVVDELSELLSDALTRMMPASRGRDDFISVHIRRGDYAEAQNLTRLGLTGSGFFREAHKVIAADPRAPRRCVVFTDSPEQVDDEFGLEHWSLFDPGLTLGPLPTLAAMSSGRGMILSNSSFSWWAAWMIRRRDPDSWVIAPRPWFADSREAARDLLPPTWLTLDRRV